MIAASLLFGSLALIGCNSNPTQINLNDLETVCDYVEAMEQVIDADLTVRKDKNESDLSEEEQEYLDQLKKKMYEIGEAASKKYSYKEFQECVNFKAFQKKYKESGGKNRW